MKSIEYDICYVSVPHLLPQHTPSLAAKPAWQGWGVGESKRGLKLTGLTNSQASEATAVLSQTSRDAGNENIQDCKEVSPALSLFHD